MQTIFQKTYHNIYMFVIILKVNNERERDINSKRQHSLALYSAAETLHADSSIYIAPAQLHSQENGPL